MVIAIIAILATLAVPSYQKFRVQQDTHETADRLRDHLELARTYAQNQHMHVSVCPIVQSDLSVGKPVCLAVAGRTWPAWMVVRADGQVLARGQIASDDISITSGQRNAIEFDERGTANAFSNGSITVSSMRDAQVQHTITIAASGRVTES